LTWKGKKNKDLKKKPDLGMRDKKRNTSGREEPNRVSTWMCEWDLFDLDLNYFLKTKEDYEKYAKNLNGILKPGGKVIYIDTEGGFSLERVNQISGDLPEMILKNIMILKPVNFTEQKFQDGDFIVQETISKDTPQSGYIRIVDTSASTETRYAYSSWASGVFTLDGVTLDQDYNGNDTAYIGYIDEEATTTSITKSGLQYVSDRTVVVRVRNSSPGGNQIIPFQVDATITSVGLSVPASRNPDNVIGN
jgi:hypothetical protein